MDSKYCYPGTNVLINKLGITDIDMLNEAERQFTSFRLKQLQAYPINGQFDLLHLQNIHKHIFKDMYEWAGEIRNINISKGSTMFANSLYIKFYSDLIHSQLMIDQFLHGLGIDKYSTKLAYYASELNLLHPFREGNGRSTREFLRCLSNEAGYELNYSKISVQDLYNSFVKSVSDISDLKNTFKKHFLNNTREFYNDPGIKKESDELIEKLNDVRFLSDKNSFQSLKEINELYKELGHKIESGTIDVNDFKFKLVSNIINDLRSIQVSDIQNIKQHQNNLIKGKINTIEL